MMRNFHFFGKYTAARAGVVYIMTMVLLVIFNAAAVTFLTIVRTDGKIVEAQMSGIRAFYNAESAAAASIEEFLSNFDRDGNGIGSIAPVDKDGDSLIDFRATYYSVIGNQRIEATGYSGEAQKTIVIKINPAPFLILSWDGDNFT